MHVFRYTVDLIKHLETLQGETLGLVPTMGCLHAGHLSLVAQARAENDQVATTIFVNPKQFNNTEDLEKYPKTLQEDLSLLEEAGCDLVFCPEPDQVYPSDFDAKVSLGGVTRALEGASRPGHFDGVTTVVSLLFNLLRPHNAYFGQKDAQQLAVIQKMVKDLKYQVRIVGCPTARSADGLALSSRNTRLSEPQRAEALSLYQSLCWAEQQILTGNRDVVQMKEHMNQMIEEEPSTAVDYISFADPHLLEEIDIVQGETLVSLAVFVGPVRLIDNLLISPPQ